MKKLIFLLSLLSLTQAYSQSLPFDFEDSITNPDFVDFDGGSASIVANPSTSGINLSNSVASIVRDGGAVYAGSKIILSSNLDFSELTKITMKVYTAAPIGTIVKMKLEGGGPPFEIDALTTTSGSWEELEWIFAGTPNNLNELVFMFDFGNVGDGSSNSTFYFDDIEQVQGPPAPTLTSLPIDFEAGTVSSDFLNFSGATASVVANPQMMGINNSNTVCQIIREGGDVWAGSKILLEENLDFSTMWIISMKVFTQAPVGTRIKLQLESPTSSTSLDVLTTITGNWETLTWNFDGTPNDFNRIAFMFDFGNQGDGSALSTFLFDDVQQIVGPALPDPLPATMPIDFEESVVDSDFINVFGAVATVVPNPQIDGNNSSATVGKFVRSGGQVWAQSKLALTENIDFSNLSSISMKVYTDAPVGTLLKLKVESNNNAAANERNTFTTVSGAWQTYTWDFAGDPPVYNVLTFMLGYGAIGDASPASTFLFDDIEQVPGPSPIPTTTLPVDFENIVNTGYFLDFDGGVATVISNPQMNGINMSDSVAQIVRNGGQPWGGSKLQLENNLDFSILNSISMKVYTQAPIGTIIRLKLEEDGGAEAETDIITTVSNEWETYTWNFADEPNVFNTLVFMFDFGALGGSSTTSTFLFDDIEQTTDEVPTAIDARLDSEWLQAFPNPAKDFITLSSNNQEIEHISLFDILGNQVSELQTNSRQVTLSISDLARGIYMARISTSAEKSYIKFIIE